MQDAHGGGKGRGDGGMGGGGVRYPLPSWWTSRVTGEGGGMAGHSDDRRAGNCLKGRGGGGCPAVPQHSVPDSTPEAFPSPNTGPQPHPQPPETPQPLSHPLRPLCNRSGIAPMAPLRFKQSPGGGGGGGARREPTFTSLSFLPPPPPPSPLENYPRVQAVPRPHITAVHRPLRLRQGVSCARHSNTVSSSISDFGRGIVP